MPAFKDITGQRFGRLIVVRFSHMKKESFWLCRCDCGTEKILRIGTLRAGTTTSCGCAHRDELVARNTTHGHNTRRKTTSVYSRWAMMIQRCTNPRNSRWEWYGARGITVCKRWLQFENFLADMGEPPPGTSIDRIDNNRGYEPGNCKWNTSSEQAYNRRPKSR